MMRCFLWIPFPNGFPTGSPIGTRSRAKARCRVTDRSTLSGGRFAMRLRLARFALLWERVWPPCWPALAALGAFLVLGLFDVLPSLPGLLHAAILIGLGAAFAIGLARAFVKTVIPDGFSACRR